MQISYDYTEFIQELNQELSDKILLPVSTVYIVRSSKPIINGYLPIIDWYYTNQGVTESTEPISVSEALKEMIKLNRIV